MYAKRHIWEAIQDHNVRFLLYLDSKDQTFLWSQVCLSKLAKKIKHLGTLLRKKCHPAAILLLFESEGINSFVNACFFLERPPVVLWTPFFHQKESFGFLDTKKEGPKGLFSSPDAGLSGLFRKWNKVVERVDN